jgi:hypothetical protein
MATNYIVTQTDGKQVTVNGVENVKQIYAFVEFRDEDDELIVAIQRDFIRFYSPSTQKAPKVRASFTVSGTKK